MDEEVERLLLLLLLLLTWLMSVLLRKSVDLDVGSALVDCNEIVPGRISRYLCSTNCDPLHPQVPFTLNPMLLPMLISDHQSYVKTLSCNGTPASKPSVVLGRDIGFQFPSSSTMSSSHSPNGHDPFYPEISSNARISAECAGLAIAPTCKRYLVHVAALRR